MGYGEGAIAAPGRGNDIPRKKVEGTGEVIL